MSVQPHCLEQGWADRVAFAKLRRGPWPGARLRSDSGTCGLSAAIAMVACGTSGSTTCRGSCTQHGELCWGRCVIDRPQHAYGVNRWQPDEPAKRRSNHITKLRETWHENTSSTKPTLARRKPASTRKRNRSCPTWARDHAGTNPEHSFASLAAARTLNSRVVSGILRLAAMHLSLATHIN